LSRYAAGREQSAQLLLRQHLRLGQAFHVGASAPVAMTMDKRLSLTDCPKCKPPARSMVGCPSISRVCPECGGGGRVTPLRREQLLSVIDLVGLQLQVAQQVLKPDWCRLSLCGPSAPALGARHLLPDRCRRAAANAAAGLGHGALLYSRAGRRGGQYKSDDPALDPLPKEGVRRPCTPSVGDRRTRATVEYEVSYVGRSRFRMRAACCGNCNDVLPNYYFQCGKSAWREAANYAACRAGHVQMHRQRRRRQGQ